VLAGLLADLEHGGDVRVTQPGGGAGLLGEALDKARILGDVGTQQLEGDDSVQRGIAGFVDGGKAALADLFDDLVLAE
jgi:hypothetical protein